MIKQLLREIKAYSQDHATGRLDIQNITRHEPPWSIYFGLGRLVWASGGDNEQRRIYRQISKHLPKNAMQVLELHSEFSEKSEGVYYRLIANLLNKNIISLEQFIAIKNEIITEVLFDILQIDYIQNQHSSEYASSSGLHWEWFANIRPQNYTPVSPKDDQATERLVTEGQDHWLQWQQLGLANCFPEFAPIMTDPEKIQATTAPKTFQNLQRLVTGNQSLRDIAATTKRDLIPVTKVLWGYHQKGWLKFEKIPDLNWMEKNKTSSGQTATTNSSKGGIRNQNSYSFVVACVDDSPQVTQTIEKILEGTGYEFVGINDPLRATASLLKLKPDLIFLDLIMPNTNGYEICTQLRRVSSLQEIPIIILTGKDGLIDRMRAKMVGATEYLSKPVEDSTVLEFVQKYLPTPIQSENLESQVYQK